MSKASFAVLVPVLLFGASGIATMASPSRDSLGFTIAHARLLRDIGRPTISPDGRSVTYVLDEREIWISPIEGGEGHPLPWQGGYVDRLRWIPDGSAVSFLARDDRAVRQVWSMPSNGGRVETLTSQSSDVTDYAWSRDGRRLALITEGSRRQPPSLESPRQFSGEQIDAAFEGATLQAALLFFSDVSGLSFIVDPDVRGTVHARFRDLPWDEAFERLLESQGLGYTMNGPSVRVGRLSTLNALATDGDRGPQPLVIDRISFKDERAGYHLGHQRRLVIRDLGSGAESFLIDLPPSSRDLTWSPNGRLLAFAGAGAPDGRGALSVDVFVADLVNGEIRSLARSPLDEDVPTFTQDGHDVVYRREANPNDWPSTTHELAVVSVLGGEDRLVVRGLDRQIEQPQIAADTGHLWFLVPDQGTVRLARARLDDGRIDNVMGGEQRIASFDVDVRGQVVVVSSTTNRPASLFSVTSTGVMRPVADPNASVVSDLQLAAARRISTKGAGGARVEAFFLPPTGTAALDDGPFPAIVWLHGGPYSQHTASFDPVAHLLSAAGFAVILPNPRGSSGYGARFATAIRGAWGTHEYRDVRAIVDEAVTQGLVDSKRLGVGGWSYGGWLTNHILTRTQRFKAAVTGASLSNMFADYGVSDTALWTEREFGLPWLTPARYVEASPLFEVDHVRTPTLVLCGEKDIRTPLGQSEQWYYALKRVGVAAELVIYPGEGHALSRDSQIDAWERTLAWYGRVLSKRTDR